VSCGVSRRRASDLALVWLCPRPAAAAPIQPLAWELPYAVGAALKRPPPKKNLSILRLQEDWGLCGHGHQVVQVFHLVEGDICICKTAQEMSIRCFSMLLQREAATEDLGEEPAPGEHPSLLLGYKTIAGRDEYWYNLFFIYFFIFLPFCPFRAAPVAYGGAQAESLTRCLDSPRFRFFVPPGRRNSARVLGKKSIY